MKDKNTICIIAGGPSLIREDVERFERATLPLMGTNNAYQITDKLTYLYACDTRWWDKHYHNTYPCKKYSLLKTKYPDVQQMKDDGVEGLSLEWPKLKNGKNSGYQAINLAVLLGYKYIVLLGYDMQLTGDKIHWHGRHEGLGNPTKKNLQEWCNHYNNLAVILKRLNIKVFNFSRETALTCFPRFKLG